MNEASSARGLCWCGCGSGTAPDSLFLPGHDRAAMNAVVQLEYGGIAQFLEAHGFGPEGRSAIRELAELRRNEPGQV